ncbi:MAG TPA: hypothetical protein VFU71_22405, partial [Burkholderiaceae bacterium]|nr:hypothetical protein [Burkholderiaceae bacterium]
DGRWRSLESRRDGADRLAWHPKAGTEWVNLAGGNRSLKTFARSDDRRATRIVEGSIYPTPSRPVTIGTLCHSRFAKFFLLEHEGLAFPLLQSSNRPFGVRDDRYLRVLSLPPNQAPKGSRQIEMKNSSRARDGPNNRNGTTFP